MEHVLCGRKFERPFPNRWLKEDLISVFIYVEGHGEDEARFFSEVHNDRMRRTGTQCMRNVGKTLGKRIQKWAAKT